MPFGILFTLSTSLFAQSSSNPQFQSFTPEKIGSTNSSSQRPNIVNTRPMGMHANDIIRQQNRMMAPAN